MRVYMGVWLLLSIIRTLQSPSVEPISLAQLLATLAITIESFCTFIVFCN